MQKHFYTGCIDISFTQCEPFDEIQNYLYVQKFWYIGCIYTVSPQCVLYGDLQECV